MTGKPDDAQLARIGAAIDELQAAIADVAGQPVTQLLIVRAYADGSSAANYIGCGCPMCRMRMMIAAGTEMGGRMQAVRLPDEPTDLVVDAAGTVH